MPVTARHPSNIGRISHLFWRFRLTPADLAKLLERRSPDELTMLMSVRLEPANRAKLAALEDGLDVVARRWGDGAVAAALAPMSPYAPIASDLFAAADANAVEAMLHRLEIAIELAQPSHAGVARAVESAALQTAEQWGLSATELQAALGLPAAARPPWPPAARSDAAVMLAIDDQLAALIPDAAAVRAWLRSPNRDLGVAPVELLASPLAMRRLYAYLGVDQR